MHDIYFILVSLTNWTNDFQCSVCVFRLVNGMGAAPCDPAVYFMDVELLRADWCGETAVRSLCPHTICSHRPACRLLPLAFSLS